MEIARPAHLKRTQTHGVWDRSIPPVLHIEPGETVVVELENASGGQLDADSTASALTSLDFTRINPVTGPIYVESAKAGDALVVEILELDVDAWGWTANIPGFGLLADRLRSLRCVPRALRTGRSNCSRGCEFLAYR